MKAKWIFLGAAAAVALSISSAGAAELRVGIHADALTLDPATAMKVVPELAESWTALDPLTYEFKLRQGVTFHDGSPMTAEDIKFTFDRLVQEGAMEGQTSPRKGLLGPLSEINIVDERTVRFILSEPWPILPAMLPFQEVVSKAHVEKVGTNGMADQVNGTGPFKLIDWRKGDSVIMERYDGYYGGASDIPPVGKACVERVIFKVIPENASRVAALLAGDVHIIDALPTHSVKQVENNPGTRVMSVRGTRSSYIALNTQKAPFNDVRVRHAVAHALDRQLIVDRILDGNATLIDGILSPDAFGKNTNLPAYAVDPEKAKALLAEAGYPNGIDVALDVEGAHKDTAEAIASLLTKAGIRTKVVVGESSQLVSRYRTKGEPIDGQMWLTSWGNGSLDPADIFVPTHRSADRGNSSGYANPELDALLDAANTELDQSKRAELYQQAEAIVNRDLPKVYLWVAKELYGVSEKVSGWQPSADSRINLHDACLQ
jgi:peptide/nickel transport system substrate-binding protein